jgi:ribosomal protein S18 acetylase RimI-like enzyme
MKMRLTVRDLEPPDLADLDWSGGPEHLGAVAAAVQASYTGEAGLVVATLDNGRLAGLGAVDFRGEPGSGLLWMLSVHEVLQGLGIGTRLIRALERRIVQAGRSTARIQVEHDNPRARMLYRRLGYREIGSTLDAWPVTGGKTYVTVCTMMERALGPGEPPTGASARH